MKIAEKGKPPLEVLEFLKTVGDFESEIKANDIWLKVPHKSFMSVVEKLFELDFLHFHIISGSDAGEFVELRYHFSLFSYAGRGERVGVSVMVNVPKGDLVMPSLFSKIPGSEYSERETREMYGIDFDGLPNKALVFLPDKWDESIKPWRTDEAGLSSRPDMVRRLS